MSVYTILEMGGQASVVRRIRLGLTLRLCERATRATSVEKQPHRASSQRFSHRQDSWIKLGDKQTDAPVGAGKTACSFRGKKYPTLGSSHSVLSSCAYRKGVQDWVVEVASKCQCPINASDSFRSHTTPWRSKTSGVGVECCGEAVAVKCIRCKIRLHNLFSVSHSYSFYTK